jgi:peptidoglycan/LPS O-acetylase OafA/YrhL
MEQAAMTSFATVSPSISSARSWPTNRASADPASNRLLANLSQREIPSLYGLRGIAALTVVSYHYLEGSKLNGIIPGPYAVTLFFELSGLLITWLLLKEIETTGRVAWGFFYYRRALRLFPLFYVIWILCRMADPFPGSVATFFYMGDYYTALTGHYSILTSAWSLGVEEKFYLLWPWLLVRIKGQMRIKVLSGVLLFEPVYRSTLTLIGFRTYTWFAFDTHLDAIVLGCLIAILAKEGWNPPRWLFHRATPWIALVLVFALQSQGDIVTYLLAVILISVVSRPAALLNSGVARYFGRISYALYLCHVYTSAVIWPRLCVHILRHVSLPLSLIAQIAIATAFASMLHFVVERPFLLIKDRSANLIRQQLHGNLE